MLYHEILLGNSLYQKMSRMQKDLEDDLSYLYNLIAHYPEGELCCTRNSRWSKWYRRKEGKLFYLPKNQRETACDLADKKCWSDLIQDLQHDLGEVRQYLRKHKENPLRAKKLLTTPSPYTELLTSFNNRSQTSRWMEERWEQNPYYPEQKIHAAPGNLFVRSKSEAMIATLLSANQIPFRYECALSLGRKTLYPDFTVRHPVTGKIYHWEHFGKMDDPDYRARACAKINEYSKHGIHPSMGLIITAETKEEPLSILSIQCKIQELNSMEQKFSA